MLEFKRAPGAASPHRRQIAHIPCQCGWAGVRPRGAVPRRRAGTRGLLLAWALCVSGACNRGPAPALDGLGDPCRSIARTCEGDDALRVCQDQRRTVVPCAERCAAQVPGAVSLGCSDPGEGFIGDECSCAPPQGQPCQPGTTRCDGLTLQGCAPSGLWRTYSCQDLCAEGSALPLQAAGCAVGDDGVATCVCSAEGTPCPAEGQVQCADRSHLATCTAGTWSLTLCTCPPPSGAGPPAPGLCLPGDDPTTTATCTC